MTITKYGQQILDCILDHVETAPQRGQTGGHGHTGWTIGRTRDVTAFVAARLDKSINSVAGGLSDLIEKGYLCNDLLDHWHDLKGDLALTHQGWLAYSRWSVERLLRDMQVESLEEWQDWDGVDGTPFTYHNVSAFGRDE